ncbi:MAG: tyrosine-type recombinase/integrase [Chromatiaceae bacterium]|nr:tyrosine-type recombinase/integrase [Chromatiaceae bacterium]
MQSNDSALICGFLQYLEFRGRAQGTIENYHCQLKRLVDFLVKRGKTLATASGDEVQAFAGLHLHELRVQPRSRRPAVAAVRGFYKWARQFNQIEKNPAVHLHYPRTGRKLPASMQLNALESMLMEMPLEEFRGVRDAAIVLLLAGTGIRVSGLVRLNEDDFVLQRDEQDIESAFVRVSEKGANERLVPVPAEALLMVRAYLGHPDIDPDKGIIDRTLASGSRVLFVNTRNPTRKECDNVGESRRLSSSGVRRMLKKYGRLAGIPEKLCHPHALRHLYATELVESDVDLVTVQHLMGHRKAESSRIYIHLAVRRLRAAADKGNPLGKIRTPTSGLVPLLSR